MLKQFNDFGNSFNRESFLSDTNDMGWPENL